MSLQSLVAYLVDKKGTIPGKKAFQKYMYFLDAQGVPTSLSFRIHHFGPYSSDLDYQTDNLEIQGAISVSPKSGGTGFVIQSGTKTKDILSENRLFLNEHAPKMDVVLEALPKESRTLELWSTTHFVANAMNKFYDGADKETVVQEVRKIKQDKFSAEEISDAYDQLIRLALLP